MRRVVPVILALLVGLLASASASAQRGLATGFADPIYRAAGREGDLYADRAVEANAGIIRVFVDWDDVVAGTPSNPSQPDDPAYDFSGIDRAVLRAASRDLDVLLTTYKAPGWAEGPNRPSGVADGSWKVDSGDLADFEQALARRYSGSFGGLPQVRYLQVWNEPNLDLYLAPQWRNGRPYAAGHYRSMLNAAYGAIKSVSPETAVVSAGLAPYGDSQGGPRTRPLTFWRRLLCLDSGLGRACGARSRFDVFGEHAINTSGPPRQGALNKNDMSSGDLGRGRRILRAAERAGTVTAGNHPIWVTEFWWESNPPDRFQGYSPARQARYVEETIYLAWKAGATVAIALQIRDARFSHATRFNHDATGIYTFADKAKPSARAFRFPFVAERRAGGNAVRLWGRAPASGRVVIERRKDRRWRPIERTRTGRSGIFTAVATIRGAAAVRARSGEENSIPWRLKRRRR
jgi:hypothetical protein